jgi:thymidylate synthase (FAD)
MNQDCRVEVLDSGFISLINTMGSDKTISDAARVSFSTEKDEFDEADSRLIRRLWKDKHTSPFEHVHFTFYIKCPLPVARQWMRHRTWNYSEVSRRYTSENIDFYKPEFFREQSFINKQASTDISLPVISNKYWLKKYDIIIRLAHELYNGMIIDGICREQARLVLPQAMYTKFIATVDLHNLFKFLSLRLADDAQWEFRQYAIAICSLIKPVIPVAFEIFESELNSEKNSRRETPYVEPS